MNNVFNYLHVLLFVPAFIYSGSLAESTGRFASGTHTFQNITLPYRLYSPDTGDASAGIPLLLALHGAGGRGTDNTSQITAYRIVLDLADSSDAGLYPCFILAPQCPNANSWEAPAVMDCVRDLLDSLIRNAPVDAERVYITGFSMGGTGTFAMIMRYPEFFAAAVPCCGRSDAERAGDILHVPVWMNHGSDDGSIAVTWSRNMAAAFTALGRPCVFTHYDYIQPSNEIMTLAEQRAVIMEGADCLFSEYPDLDHMALCTPFNHPLLYTWLFMKRNTRVHVEPLWPDPDFRLQGPWPNPCNGRSRIRIVPGSAQSVRIRVFDVRGRLIHTESRFLTPGSHVIDLNLDGPSGTYLVCCETGHETLVRKVLMIR
ncbi:T9SS type A sorting domain-containing protein [bacterium]|nr:T9SS type A sorting domain-containing protein [bacterium]